MIYAISVDNLHLFLFKHFLVPPKIGTHTRDRGTPRGNLPGQWTHTIGCSTNDDDDWEQSTEKVNYISAKRQEKHTVAAAAAQNIFAQNDSAAGDGGTVEVS